MALLHLPQDVLQLVSDFAPEANLGGCCSAFMRMLAHRHVAVLEEQLHILLPSISSIVHTLCCSMGPPRGEERFWDVLQRLETCTHLENVQIVIPDGHVLTDATESMLPLTNPFLTSVTISIGCALLTAGALSTLLGLFTSGTLPSLAEIRLIMQPNRHINPEELDCLTWLWSPNLRLRSLDLVFSGTTWNGDRLLWNCCPSDGVVLGEMRRLRLRMADTAISNWAAEDVIPELLRTHPHLTDLDLNINRGDLFTRRSIHSLTQAIANLTGLRRLRLEIEGCDMCDTSALGKLQALPHLHTLQLFIGHNPQLNVRMAMGLRRLLHHRFKCLTLDFSHTQVPAIECAYLTGLSHLTLRSSSTMHHGGIGMLRSCAPGALEHIALDFSVVRLGDLGCRHLGHTLMRFTNTSTLIINLRNNLLRDVGLHALLTAVEAMKRLRHLELRLDGNLITIVGVRSFGRLLQLHPDCTMVVDVSSNPIGYDGARILAMLSEHRPKLNVLVRSSQPMTEPERYALLGRLTQWDDAAIF